MRTLTRAIAALGGLLYLASPLVAQASMAPSEAEDLAREVEAVERAFADTMAQRDHDAFTAFLSEEAIFFSGETALRGKQAVADAWSAFFEEHRAPFSWQPETVEVLESGTLALSTGPVRDAAGTLISTFTSIWRLEGDGRWRIVFDKGNRVCPPVEQP